MMCAISNALTPTVPKRKRKILGLPMQLDASVWFVVVAVLLAGIVAGAMHLVKESRVARARLEMDSLRTAVLEYEAYMGKDITEAGGFSVLFSEFTDPQDDKHAPILHNKGNWQNNKPIDPWGAEYEISGSMGSANRTIHSKGPGSDDSEGISISL